jgi:dihydroneopterin aldolase
MDSVFIEELRLRGKHGVYEHERQSEQEFLVDIRVSFDMRKAAHSDDLADTINYATFAAIAKDVVEKNSFYLIERLGETICERILEDKRIKDVSVTIRKPAALPSGVPGVTIVRQR